METLHSILDSPALLPAGLLLLWFYTVWQSYVIEGTRARLAGLEEIWREALSLNSAWCYCPAVATVRSVLDSSGRALPRLSLASLFIALVLRGRQVTARDRLYESLRRLPSGRAQEDAMSIVEAATRYVVVCALKRSLVVWMLAPVFLAGFIAWSAHWQLLTVLEGASPGSVQLAGRRLRRKVLAPLLGIVAPS